MGRKSKPPVYLNNGSEVKTEVSPNDGLPLFANYIDIPFERRTAKCITRLFFKRPTHQEIEETIAIRNQNGISYLAVVSARLPYWNGKGPVLPSIYDYCISKGFSKEFSSDLVRLIIHTFKGAYFSNCSVSGNIRSLITFVDFLSIRFQNLAELNILGLMKQDWLDFIEFVNANVRSNPQNLFAQVKRLFANYEPTSLHGWLKHIAIYRKQPNVASQNASELVDATYSDAIMYQMLALFIEGFQRRIGYLKRYESLTTADMPNNWIFPGKNNYEFATGVTRGGMEKGKTYDTVLKVSMLAWLNDEERGYQILIDHFIMHHKANLIYRDKQGGFRGGLLNYLNYISELKQHAPLVTKFKKTISEWHNLPFPMKGRSVWSCYLRKQTPDESNTTINQIGWCLMNLLMIQTGINREVALTIPSKDDSGNSILLREDSVFIKKNDASSEVELFGYKERTGNIHRKKILFTMVKNTPLFEMMLAYEKYVKVSSEGSFFEFDKSFIQSWNKAGGIRNFSSTYPIIDENGKKLESINSTKFRKVFATAKLLEHLQNVKSANDLAEKLRQDLHHANFDTTLSHYLLNSHVSRSVIDIAIATITSEKIEEALKFKGFIVTSEIKPVKKMTYLCDCEDPLKPSHEIAIASECRHYDLCLGCERSVITKFHLPYICARILQYEEERKRDPLIWPATSENLWLIANDALAQYQEKNKESGGKLVEEAWVTAKSGSVSLPPIIRSIRM